MMVEFDEVVRGFGVLDELAKDDERLAEAWAAVRGWLTMGRIPPAPLGGVAGSALELARLAHKTGVESGWETPPRHSEAMERLILRLTALLETFLDLYAEDLKAYSPSRDFADGVQRVFLAGMDDESSALDEAYQVSYCDGCGTPLSPAGICWLCASLGVGN